MSSTDPSKKTGTSDEIRHPAPADGASARAEGVTPAQLRERLTPLVPREQRDRQRSESGRLARELRAAIGLLEALPSATWANPAIVTAYLTAIFSPSATPPGVDPAFLLRRDQLRVSDVVGAGSETGAPSRVDTLLSAHLFIVIYPERAFLETDALMPGERETTLKRSNDAGFYTGDEWRFDVAGWKAFVNGGLHATALDGVGAFLNSIFVEDLPARNADAMFRRSLANWVAEPVDDEENRVEAALLIQMCSENGARSLDLSYLGLTSLPDALWRVDRTGTECFENGGLQDLRLNGNRLNQMPGGLGRLVHLRRLNVSGNQLSVLPETIGRLKLLESLRAGDNELSVLPDAICSLLSLKALVLDTCLLTSVPRGVGALQQLRELELEDNLLTSLPNGVSQLSADCLVRLFDNPLSAEVRLALKRMSGGPMMLVDPVIGRDFAAAPRPLDESMAHWLAGEPGPVLDKSAISSDDAAQAFSAVLDGWALVPDAMNWNTRTAFQERIRDALRALGSDSALASRCIAWMRQCDVMSDDALLACLAQIEAMIEDASAQRGNWPMQEILRGALQHYHVKVLDEMVSASSAAHPYCDPADIRWAYRAALGQRFDFPEDGYGSESIACSAVDETSVLLGLEHMTKASRSEGLLDFIVDYAPWRSAICRQYPAELEALLGTFDEAQDALLNEHEEVRLSLLRDMQAAQTGQYTQMLKALTRPWLPAHIMPGGPVPGRASSGGK